MRIKTYHGSDLAAALARARAELGPNALVLATSEIKGRMGLTRVEITVAVDRPLEARTDRELRRIAEEVRERQGSDAGASIAERHDDGPGASKGAAGRTGNAARHDPLRGAMEALTRTGLSSDLVQRFAAIASRELPASAAGSGLATAAERGVAGLLSFEALRPRPGAWFLVGPPGSGKTTTTAKFAARLKLRARGEVVLAQADQERVGADEQGRIYCQHLGARFAAVDDVEDLRRIAAALGRRDALLIDTPGIGAADGERLERLVRLRRALPRAGVAMLIPSGLHRDEARRVIDRFGPLEPSCAGFSKVDDGGRLGDLVNALAATRLPLAFVTDGHRIPDDLHDASPRSLAALMLRSGYRKQPTQQEIVR